MQLHNLQLTYYSNKETQTSLNIVLREIALVFEKMFSTEQTAALILIGGYGRGEGGIMLKDGKYCPHNNLDILYIYNKSIDAKLIQLADSQLQKIAEIHNIGIDMSAINKQKLMRLNGLVIGYDMRYGHKTLLGDSQFLKEHKKFCIDNIDPVDVRQLLVNRGTLLLINRVILKKETLTIDEKKLIIKHSIKAIIGYCDALLYFNGSYHWSYAQKQTNFSQLKGIDNSIKELYSQAILFRFMPDYDTYLKKDLQAWNDELIEVLCSIHLECEKINLSQANLDWENYFNIALDKKSYPRQNLLQKAKSSVHGIRNISVACKLNSSTEMISFMQLGARGMLSLLFPYIAYKIYPKHYHSMFKVALKEPNELEFLKGFLTLWSKHGDTNFINVLRTYNIELEQL